MPPSISLARRLLGIGASAVTGLAASALYAAPADQEAHREAVAQARAGSYGESLQTLERLARQHIDQPRYFYDYILVLNWAGRDAEVLGIAERVPPRAPAYVHEAIGRAACNLGKHAIAATRFRYAMAASPEALTPVIGLARVQRESGNPASARQTLLGVEPIHGRAPDWMIARAHVAESETKYLEALTYFQRAQQVEPERAEAISGQARIASRLGAPRIAVELAVQHPKAIDAKQLASLIGDQAALSIRAGAAMADAEPRATRFAMLDGALAESDALAIRLDANPASIDATERRRLVDRLHALSQRYRMRDAVALFELLVQSGHVLPAYGKRAAANAYLYLEQPRQALLLYEAADIEDPEDVIGRFGQFHALVENERHADAIAFVDRMSDALPRRVGAWSDPTTRDNPDYVSAQVARANARTYADDLGNAERMIRALRSAAPASHEVRLANAALDKARGRPRLADAELQSVIQHEEDNAGAHAERVSALLEVHEFRAAERAIAEARQRRPEDKRTQRAERHLDIHNSTELVVEASRGLSRGNAPGGTQDHAIDSFLYSSPIDYRWRAFGHLHLAEAKFEPGDAKWHRLGAGAEYRVRDWRLTGEVNGKLDGGGDTGGTVGARWWANDHWNLAGSIEAQSNAVPLQARIANVSGKRAAVELVHRVHESRSFDVTFGVMEFSDTNRRQTLSGSWDERWVSGPRLKLSTTLGAYTSRNSLAGTAYFNPGDDASLSGATTLEWVTWREYTRSFTQRFTALAGRYSQQGFSAGPIWSGEYEHVLKWNERFEVRYGLSRTVHPYDGRQAGRNALHLGLNWRF
ncbi:MAG: poly-beta-1,6 N-acetyl-D-glucosamine export porin PgaA [Burkholderiales bacterium]